MEEAIEFLRAAAEVECRARRAMILERDDRKLKELIREWDAMSSGLRSGLSRGAGLPSRFFEAPSQLANARNTKPRTVFAVARHEQGKADLYRGWMGDTALGPRGDSLTQSLYVARVKGELKIVSRYDLCSTCGGAIRLENGRGCPDCAATGWQHFGGAELANLGPPEEVHKLAKPSDPLSRPLYDAIDEPA
jgi:hypothetical protein